MTVQAGIELDLDLAELVGEMPAVPCEGAYHGEPSYPHHDGGPATHYVQHFHPCKGPSGMISTRCAKAAEAIKADANEIVKCGQCGEMGPLSKFIIVLGPITK